MKRRVNLNALLAAVGLVAGVSLHAQEPVPIDFPPAVRSPIRFEDLRPSPRSSRADLFVQNVGERPLTLRVRPGTPFFDAAGSQGVMALNGLSVLLPPGSGSMALPIEVLCYEAEGPLPSPSTRWQPPLTVSPDVAEKQAYLLQLANGLNLIDAELATLSPVVRVRDSGGETAVDYEGAPLTPALAHLLRTADWTVGADGATQGVLNRAVVAQFAFWALTDNYTEDDLARRLREPQFAHAQPRAASIRWSVRYLLERSDLKPTLFDPEAPETAFNRGVDELRRGRWREAAILFETALERRQDYHDALFNLALAYAQDGRGDDARRVWQRAAELAPRDPDSSYNLAALAYRAEDYADAAELLSRSIELDPNHTLARQWLPRVEAHLSKRQQ